MKLFKLSASPKKEKLSELRFSTLSTQVNNERTQCSISCNWIIQLPLLGGLPAWTLVLAPCFFFSPFLGRFLLMEFGRVSSIAFTSCVRFAQVVYGYPCLGFLNGCTGRRESEVNSITQAGLLTLGDWTFRVQSVAAIDHFFLFPWIQQPLFNSLPCNISVWFNSIYLQQITKWLLEGQSRHPKTTEIGTKWLKFNILLGKGPQCDNSGVVRFARQCTWKSFGPKKEGRNNNTIICPLKWTFTQI